MVIKYDWFLCGFRTPRGVLSCPTYMTLLTSYEQYVLGLEIWVLIGIVLYFIFNSDCADMHKYMAPLRKQHPS